jgi:Protein of unknown function (DUF3467)
VPHHVVEEPLSWERIWLSHTKLDLTEEKLEMPEEQREAGSKIQERTFTRDITQIPIMQAPDFKSVYANNVNFVTTPWDFALLFGQTRPENPENIHLELRVTVTLSPQMAKAVALTLMQNVHNYEQQFGEIRNTPLPQKPETPST